MSRDEGKIINLEIKISGKVQNVGFRFFAKIHAHKFGIKGFCRNKDDGSLLVVCSGKKENQERFLKKLQKGPLFARVDNLEAKEVNEIQTEDFEIIK